jgi:hypothetical protein
MNPEIMLVPVTWTRLIHWPVQIFGLHLSVLQAASEMRVISEPESTMILVSSLLISPIAALAFIALEPKKEHPGGQAIDLRSSIIGDLSETDLSWWTVYAVRWMSLARCLRLWWFRFAWNWDIVGFDERLDKGVSRVSLNLVSRCPWEFVQDVSAPDNKWTSEISPSSSVETVK